jgi:uncharacterized protein DUF4019
MRRLLSGLAMIAVAALLACSPAKNLEVAESEVARFHKELDAGNFDQIYASASDDLKKASGHEEFVKLLRAVNSKLGPTRMASRTGWNMNLNTSGNFVTLTFDTQFEKGKGTEQFVYRIASGKALLAGYHIMSNDLIVN